MSNSKVLFENFCFDNKIINVLDYKSLSESDQKVFTTETVQKLFKMIKKKSLTVNYLGIDKTNGDITRFSKYDDIENSIKILNNMYHSNPTIAPKEVLLCVKTLDILKHRKVDFGRAFSQKNEIAIMLYTNIVATLISGTSLLVSKAIEYVKTPTNEFKEQFAKNSQKMFKEDVYFASLDKFITLNKNGELDTIFKNGAIISEAFEFDYSNVEYLNEKANYNIGPLGDIIDLSKAFLYGRVEKEGGVPGDRKNRAYGVPAEQIQGRVADFLFKDKDGSISKVKIAISVVLSIFAIIMLTRNLIYHFYHAKKVLSESLLNLAYFLEQHALQLDTSTETGKKVRERQLKIVEKLKVLGKKLIGDNKTATKNAEQDKKDDAKELADDNSSSDDDVLL